MGYIIGLWWLIFLITLVKIEAQKNPSTNLDSKCLGNIMRVDVGPFGGNLLEVAGVINDSAIVLTPSLASQCGFRIKTFPPGTAVIYASIQNCFAENVDDNAFTTTLNLRLSGNQIVEDDLHQVVKTCPYNTFASRDIVCDIDYMEVSVKRTTPDDNDMPQQPIPWAYQKPGRAAEKLPMDAGFRATKLIFFTPEEKILKVAEAWRRGYGITNTATRLFLRSPKRSPETYTQDVAGVTMTGLKTSVIIEKKWQATQINVAAACPTLASGVYFTENTIRWFLPWHIDPLITSGQFQLLELHVGVDGERLDPAEAAARQYSVTVDDVYIVVEIPFGAVGGHFKSHVQDNQYFTSYTIELMIELLWTEDSVHEDTRYKVLLPIMTPPWSHPPYVIDYTIPEGWLFDVLLGSFGPDVALINITFPVEVLSVADCNVRGLNVLEHTFPNSSSKYFTLKVPFTDRVVLQKREMGMIIYSLRMTFNLVVLPEFIPFSHTAYLVANLVDVVPPSISGGCDYENFFIIVKYGSEGFNFETIVGKQTLTSGLAQQYSLMENGTHLSFVVPFSSPNVVLQNVQASSVSNRLDVTLRNPQTEKVIEEFSVSCNDIRPLIECFPNGTITALAVKLEAVPGLNMSELVLNDPTCHPSYSDDRYAYFVFTGSSCGTKRKFFANMMLYENEISLPDEVEMKEKQTDEPEYELKVSCYYDINKTHAVVFNTRSRRSEPYAENAKGKLHVTMRVALDDSYTRFHTTDDYPISKYLQHPVYFEVELKGTTNPDMSVELENCWASLYDNRTSQPRWNLIINGCANPVDPNKVIFHPVRVDDRVQYPSHFKRFEILMFAFAQDKENLDQQAFVHCDVVICDGQNPQAGACNKLCSEKGNRKGQRRTVSDYLTLPVLSGPILIIKQ